MQPPMRLDSYTVLFNENIKRYSILFLFYHLVCVDSTVILYVQMHQTTHEYRRKSKDYVSISISAGIRNLPSLLHNFLAVPLGFSVSWSLIQFKAPKFFPFNMYSA